MTSYPTRFALIANVIKCFRANVNQELVSEAPAFVLIGWKDHLNLSFFFFFFLQQQGLLPNRKRKKS